MRSLILALLLGASVSQAAETVYVVQASTVTAVYDDSIVRELKKRHPDVCVRALFLRDFSMDKFAESKGITESVVSARSATHDNLVLLGDEAIFANMDDPLNTMTKVPVFFDASASAHSSLGAGVPSVVQMVKSDVSLSNTVYILSDKTEISQLRLRQFTTSVAGTTIKIVPKTVNTTVELRAAMLKLGREPRSVILYNVFSLYDPDTLTQIPYDEGERLFVELNIKHVEAGVLRPGSRLALSFGSTPNDITSYIESRIWGSESSAAVRTSTGINLNRIQVLRLQDYVVKHASEIQHVEAKLP